KYPLAIVNRLMDTYGKDLSVGYDIACSFGGTLECSSMGPMAEDMHLSLVVPAFHRYAHNHGCQVNNHPMYKRGVGDEDFEQCECLFSSSNGLAPSTRLATDFHCSQEVEEHFTHWSEEKNADSGNFIYQNYHQALQTICKNKKAVDAVSKNLGTSSEDYQQYLNEEKTYLRSRKIEPSEILQTVEYMEKLQKLQTIG
ncbi:hypothetical protein BU17DRAFT_40283, partial [Hysterangium stoloniferum]